MANKKASVKDIVLALAKERGLEVSDIDTVRRISGGGVKGRLESGAGFAEAFAGAGKEKIKDIRGAFSKEGVKSFGKKVYREFFKGDDIFSAYARGRLNKPDLKKERIAPEVESSRSEAGSTDSRSDIESNFLKESSENLQILAENTMSIETMARDVNVMRQNLQELVKIWSDKDKGKGPATKADIHHRTEAENRKRLQSKVEKIRAEDVDYFAEQDKREAELEAARLKTPTPGGGKEDEEKVKEKPQSFVDGIIKMFSRGFMSAIKFLLNPKFLLRIFSRVFLPIALIGTLWEGITDGFKRYKETGSFTEAIVAGLGGMLKFLTFGLFGEDTVKKLFDSVSDFFKPILETITNVFTAIKDFFVKIFGGKIAVKDKEPPKAKEVTPSTPAGGTTPAATPSESAAPAGGTTPAAAPSGETATPTAAPAGTTAPASSEMTGTVSTTESSKSTTPTPTPSATAAGASEMTGTVAPSTAPSATPIASKPAETKQETAPAKVEAKKVDQHQLAVNLQNLQAAEGGLKFIYKDYLETKSRAKEGLLREGRKFSDDPNSPDYPYELQGIDEEFGKKIKGQQGKIEYFKNQPGVKEWLKENDKKEQKFEEEKKEAEKSTIKAEETAAPTETAKPAETVKAEEPVKTAEMVKPAESTTPEKVGGSEYTTGNKVEKVSDGAETTVKVTTPEAKKAQERLKELDERQEQERMQYWEQIRGKPREQGGLGQEGLRIRGGAEARKSMMERDYATEPKLIEFKKEQDEIRAKERAELLRQIEEGTKTEIKKQTAGPAAPPAEEKPAGGGGGGSSISGSMSDKGKEEKPSGGGGGGAAEKPTEEKTSGGGGAGALESIIGKPSSEKAAEEQKKSEGVEGEATAPAAGGVSPTPSGGGGGAPSGGAPSEAPSGGGAAGASQVETPITTPSQEASTSPQMETPTETKIPPGDMISKTSAEVAEKQRMESAADEGTTVNAPTTNNNSGGKPQSSKQKADDVYDTELIDRLAYS